MRRTLPLLLCLLIATAGCARPAAETPAPAPSATPAPAEPTSTAGPPATPTAMPTPVLPTATPVPVQHARPGRLESSEGGLALSYPTNWRLEEQTEQLGTLAFLINPNQTAYTVVYQSLRPTDRSLEEAAQSAHAEVYSWFENVGLLGEEPYTLDDGTPAWRSEFGATTQGVPVYIMMVTAAQGTRLVTLVAYCAAVIYDYEYETLETIASSMELSTPRVAGVSRDEAIVSVGSESENPRSYDPAYGGGHPGVFSGLVTFTPDLGLAPDLAEGWEIDPSGTVYTFHMRPNARFHDGRRLTPTDVIYSWQRALAPDTGSNVALTYLGDIVGAHEFHAGEAEEVAGLEAFDERTLQVTIDGPKSYFLQKLTAAATMVVDRANVESGPEWYRTPNGSGPYRLIRWEPGKHILFERAERFYLGPAPVRYQVTLLYGQGNFPLYEFDYVDIMGVSSIDKARAADPADPIAGQLFEQPSMCTEYVAFDSSREPFDDPLVRRAFALAVDKERYRAISWRDDALTAQGLYPPALPGYDAAFAGLSHDPTTARQLLADSRYGGAAGLPPIVLTTSGFGGEIGASVGALARMWQESLGVQVTIEQIEPDRVEEQIYAGRGGNLLLWAWCADYPDPENFADALFHSAAGQNIGHYGNTELDDLLEQARVETDPQARIGLYQQAEHAIVEDAAAIFLTHPLSRVYVKPRVRGYTQTAVHVPLERYLSIEEPAAPPQAQP